MMPRPAPEPPFYRLADERPRRCPRCNSPSPERHPAMQWEGEVQICPHPWHVAATTALTNAQIRALPVYRLAAGPDPLAGLSAADIEKLARLEWLRQDNEAGAHPSFVRLARAIARKVTSHA